MDGSNEYPDVARLARTESRLRDLLVCGLGGDGCAYERFLRELSLHLRAYFRKRLARLPDEVEDLVQETLLAVHNQRHTYQPEQPLTPWIHAIARYKMVDMLRRWSGHDALNDPLDDEADLLSSSDTQAMDAKRDVARLLERLPERQRLPIECVKLQGLSVTEAAHLTGLTESAVKIGVHRGLKVLAAMLRS
jgi:RNA polymerase sigma-70 factor (ECF subfamily)